MSLAIRGSFFARWFAHAACLALLASAACSLDAPRAEPEGAFELRSGTAGSGPVATSVEPLRELTCTSQQESACAAFGAQCVDNACNGGFAPGDGCSDDEEAACARYGTQCVDHQCSGGFGPGTGCTAREELDCAAFGTQCVDHRCSGGFGTGTGCTAREELDCAAFGTQCVDHQCSGGFGTGTGCTAREQIDCEQQGCGCVDHACVGGACPGEDCTAREQIDCEDRGLHCSGHRCVCEGGLCASEPVLPQPPEPCKPLVTGPHSVLGTTVQLWVGPRSEQQQGPIYIFWHATLGRAEDAFSALGAFGEEILAAGGVIAAPLDTTRDGVTTGNGTWHTGDFAIADYVVACAAQQLNIDTRRIWTGGDSTGGLQAGAMVYWRSSYLAAAITNSGGVIPATDVKVFQGERVAPVLTMHGARGVDQVVVDFVATSMALSRDVVGHGGFAVDCEHGGQHAAAPPALRSAAFEFLRAHPFGVEPEPYAQSLPATFPASCTIVCAGDGCACTSSGDCSEGNACINGTCRGSCGSTGASCGVGQACADGVCVSICASAEDCPAGVACVGGACTSVR